MHIAGDCTLSKVIDFTGISKLDVPSDKILDSAKGQLESVVLFGWDKNGEEYLASNLAHSGEILWLLERFKSILLTQQF